jgi:hypothetical protein
MNVVLDEEFGDLLVSKEGFRKNFEATRCG